MWKWGEELKLEPVIRGAAPRGDSAYSPKGKEAASHVGTAMGTALPGPISSIQNPAPSVRDTPSLETLSPGPGRVGSPIAPTSILGLGPGPQQLGCGLVVG